MNPELPRRLSREDRLYDRASIVALIIMTVIGIATWDHYGTSWDESYHLAYGEHIGAFYTSFFEDQTAVTFRIDYLYGGGFDLLGAMFRPIAKPLDKWDAIHLLGMMIGILGFWGTWRLGRALGGPRAGLLATLFIGGVGVYWGHCANNPKDLPFAVGYVWGMAYLVQCIRSFPRIGRGLAIKTAIAIGLSMSVRIGGLLIVTYFGAAVGVWVLYHAWLRRSAEAGYAYARQLIVRSIAIVAGAWVVMLVWWPWALLDPVKRPLGALRRMSQFMDHQRKMPFDGVWISNFEVDWRYMPHYFWYKLPEFLIVLFLVSTVVGLFLILKRWNKTKYFTQNLVMGVLGFSLWFPWLYAVYRESVLYDGLRHFLFEVPVLVATVAWLVHGIIDRAVRRWGKPAALVSAFVVGGLCIDQYARVYHYHPHEYTHFNRFIGGLEGADGKYSTDYYAEAYSDATRQLANHLYRTDPKGYLKSMYTVAGCGGSHRIMRWAPPNFRYRPKKGQPFDFAINYTRQHCDTRPKDAPVIYTLMRDGGRLIVVRDNRVKTVKRVQRDTSKKKQPKSKKDDKAKKGSKAKKGGKTPDRAKTGTRDTKRDANKDQAP